MTKYDKALAMKCFGRLVAMSDHDPDPNAQDKLQAEFNCKNCDSFKYCCKLADTLV
jgi:hypothetical protein